jgi:hypothetical protein
LRFVNKQLFVETRNLELRYNELEFLLPDQASFFLQRCESSVLGHLRILTVHHVKKWAFTLTEKATMDSIITFCKRFPKALVKARIIAASPNEPFSLFSMCKVERLARGTHTLLEIMNPNATWQSKEAATHSVFVHPNTHLYRDIPESDNFRLFPMDMVFNEADFKDEYDMFVNYFRRQHFYTATGVEGMIKAMKYVMEHGV